MRQITAAQAAALFEGRTETTVRAFLHRGMGRAFADVQARCAQIVVGDLCCFAGDADAPGAEELAGHVPADHPSPTLLMVPHDARWDARIEAACGARASRITRWRLHADALRESTLRPLAVPPAGYRLRRFDGALYREALKAEWSRDFAALYRDEEDYLARGIGVAALLGNELVAGASSYFSYDGGIEIQIQTREDHQRRGLARCCGAALCLLCLERGLEPDWDAANLESRRVALRLGYRDGGAYEAWEVRKGNESASKKDERL